MTFLGPLDIVLTGAMMLRRFGFARTVLGSFLLTPLYLYSLPPRPCGCIRTPFVRCDTRRPYEAALRSDLKNLASQQEIYYSDAYRYSSDLKALMFVPSNGVSLTIEASEGGWSARATHAALGGERACTIRWGTDPAEWLGEERGQPGEIACED